MERLGCKRREGMAVAKEREKIGSDDRATEVHPELR